MQTNDQIAFEIGKHRRTVEEHLSAARKKLGAKDRTDAIRKYIVLLTILGKPTCGFVRVDITGEELERILSDLSFEHAIQMIAAPEFDQFRNDLRASGLRAWRARNGRRAVALEILVGTILLALLVLIILSIGNQLDLVNGR